MKELFRSNDPVLISFVASLLTEAGIGHAIFDTNMSVVEGSLGVLPRRLMVEEDALTQARRIMKDADVEP